MYSPRRAKQSNEPVAGNPRLLALKELSLVRFRGSFCGIVALLRRCLNLEVIKFRLVDIWSPEEFKEELGELLKNVGSLTIGRQTRLMKGRWTGCWLWVQTPER